MTPTYAEEIETHYVRRWSSPIASVRWPRGPIDQLPAEFRVLLFRRSPETIAYATRCMSQPGDPVGLEIHGLCVRFLWLIPVSEAELAFKKAAGTEALEERFEKARFDYLDPFRASVV